MSQERNNREISSALRAHFGRAPRVFIRTFGCQQNVSDSERMLGLLEGLDCEACCEAEGADIIIFNTCAVREHAEDRVFGNIGRLKALKSERPELLLCVGGCMVQQEHIAKKLLESYPYVDIVFNTNELGRLPSLLAERLEKNTPLDAHGCCDWSMREGLKPRREGGFRAFVPIMYGCDNFCSYCVVPLVRGRERSRNSEHIIAEFKAALGEGYRDIMLLGQNVNSYGKGLDEDINFAGLLRKLASLEGDFTLRFMTSHPKDATRELFEVMGAFPKIAPHIHLPVQSGSDRILRLMNRRYSSEGYLRLTEEARALVPGITFSSDIIVGFPGETREDFDATLRLIREVRFASLFTFIYSKREGTPAAKMPDDTAHKTKARRLAEILDIQEEIAAERENALVGSVQRALVVERLGEVLYEGRLWDNNSIALEGSGAVGEFAQAEILSRTKKRLFGRIV
ncbi:MAG: tRNA (N6-isopentenyl adenosine(37)-C2)-methylthiotransferase MiaB [Oscillospiraceae bacterium]|nr:tRNA (N6-isopentenyl adenosine(37)-C2)-methylthiotransferase MiaB [Oscillospiraceae bacterium]